MTQENNMEKVARSSNVKRKLRDASPEAVMAHHISKGESNRLHSLANMRDDHSPQMRKNRILDRGPKIDHKDSGHQSYGDSLESWREASSGLTRDQLNSAKQNVLANRRSSRTFATHMRTASDQDKQGVADFHEQRKTQKDYLKHIGGEIQESIGKKKAFPNSSGGTDYKSPKEQWKSNNNAPKPKMNIYGKPLDPSAPKSTFTKKASDESEETKGQKVKRYAKAALKGSAKGAIKGLGLSLGARGLATSVGATSGEMIGKHFGSRAVDYMSEKADELKRDTQGDDLLGDIDNDGKYRSAFKEKLKESTDDKKFSGRLGRITGGGAAGMVTSAPFVPKNRHVAGLGAAIGGIKAIRDEYKKGKEMKKEAKSKNIAQRLMEASKSAREAYENSKKARAPKDFDPTKAVHEHHNYQYEKPKNIGKKPKIKSIDDFLNNTFY